MEMNVSANKAKASDPIEDFIFIGEAKPVAIMILIMLG